MVLKDLSHLRFVWRKFMWLSAPSVGCVYPVLLPDVWGPNNYLYQLLLIRLLLSLPMRLYSPTCNVLGSVLGVDYMLEKVRRPEETSGQPENFTGTIKVEECLSNCLGKPHSNFLRICKENWKRKQSHSIKWSYVKKKKGMIRHIYMYVKESGK